MFSVVNNISTNYATTSPYNGIWSNHPGTTVLNPPTTAEDPSLYNAPMQSGKPAERPIAMEILHTDATPDLRTGSFLRCAGSPYSRQRYVFTNHNSGTPNSLSPWTSGATEKPQLNLFFRDDLGPSPLTYPLVPGSTVTKYDNIRLRAGKNDITNPFIRDEFTRRLMLNMGQVTVRGDFVNTYVNGVFKGYYNICERPREPFFQEARGTGKSFDVRNITVIVDGDTLAYNEAVNYFRTHTMSALADYQGAQTRIDVANLADYILLNSDAAMADWPGNNYVMDRERSTAGLYRFSVWDGEGGYGGFGRNPAYKIFNDIVSGAVSTETVPAKLFYTQLRNSPEWKLLCADRIQKHFFNNGALSDTNKQALFNTLAARIQPIMTEVINQTVSPFLNIWFNGQGDTTRYTLSGGTTGSIVNCPSRRTALFTGYYDDPAGGVFVPAFFPAQGIWPATLAPALSQFGGSVAAGFQLTISNPNGSGTIYYTTNGFDPRAAGGSVQGTAYGSAITISQSTLVKARVLNSNGEWSPLTEATFAVAALPPLLITEIMYNPPMLGGVDGDEFEFLEIKNTGTQTVNLAGMHFTDGIDYTFPAGSTLAAGGFVVLAKNATQFAVKYPTVPVFGTYGATSSLSDGGETVTLADVNNAPIFSVTYDDLAPWPTSPDGAGNSLVTALLNSNPNPNDAANWRASAALGGSPGSDDVVVPTVFAYINELLANPAAGQTDAVEISNPNGVPVDISYWALSDSVATPLKYRFPANTLIPAGGYLVVDESQFNPTPGVGTSFELDRAGETVVLTSADQYNNPTGFTHSRTFGASEVGVTFGRFFDSVGVEHFVAQATPTLGAANSGPRIGPVIMSEIMYAPTAANGSYRYIELRNISNSAVPLYDPTTPASVWRVFRSNSGASGAVVCNLPAGLVLQPRQMIVLISSASDPNAFRTFFSIPGAVQILNINGGINSNADKLVLQKPIPPAGGPLLYADADAVSYNYVAPWPATPHFGGPSLERINWLAFPGDAGNWRASTAAGGTPGILPPVAFAGWQTLYFTAAQSANPNYGGSGADPDLDGLTNFWEYAMGLNPLAADAAGAAASSLAMDGGNGPYLTMQYRRNLGASGLQDFVDTAAVPGAWNPGGAVQIGTPSNNGDGTETVTRRDTETTTSAATRFIRLRFIGN